MKRATKPPSEKPRGGQQVVFYTSLVFFICSKNTFSNLVGTRTHPGFTPFVTERGQMVHRPQSRRLACHREIDVSFL